MRIIRCVKLTMSLICVMVMLSSCTLSSNNEATTEPTNQDPHDNELISNPALSRSGALVVATKQIDGNFNPLFSESTVEKWVEDLVFDGLFMFDSSGSLKGALAESMDISDDGLIYTVSLKDNLTFHDGTKLRVDDVLFTYETVLNPSYTGTYSHVAEQLLEVVAVDEYTIAFTFASERMENLQALVVPILSENYYQFSVWYVFEEGYKPPMGTGPFVFDTYVNDENIVLIKNTTFWSENAKVSGIVIKELDDESAAQAFVEGSIDLYKLPSSKSRVKAIKELGYGNVLTQKANVYTFIGMNLDLPVFSEPNIRKAMAYALDREQFTIETWNGFAETIHFLGTGIEAYTLEQTNIEKYPYNMEKAKEMLDIIGYRDDDGDGIREKNGEKLTFTWQVFTDVDWSYQLAEYAYGQWKLLGIDVKLEYVDFSTMLESLENGQTPDMWNLAWDMKYSTNPSKQFGIEEGVENYNFANYISDDANRIFKALDRSKSTFEKETLLKEWHTIQNGDLPYIPIARLKAVWAYNSRVKNLSLNDYALWTEDVTSIEIDILQ